MTTKKFLNSNVIFLAFLIFGISACTITDDGEDPLMEFSNFSFGDKKIEFKSAKLTITGPVNFSSASSHVWAKLDLSTDEKFSQPSIANSSVMSLVIYSVTNGKTLPEFPLQSGEYIVYPSSGVTEPAVIANLEEKNFSLGPSIGFNYFPDELIFESIHDPANGKIIIQFDFEKNRVNITHNWISKDGVKATGTNNLPLNLSSFKP
ncbi:hypothetical protein M3O96_12230 [Aquiflexum sp. TKW24L]|uniref:hypothetical protein n=1 Tax=Aquiflexum sp. TKW24L TaxID=2942212 RepID=UPI0020BD9F37|nr:hypothetical protein [Aquiflexum sp. TKW24L]MCL6259862.1 hypothetical protein [Aquiflexum sp. TKW24L]